MAEETERLNLDASGFIAGSEAAGASARKTDATFEALRKRVGELLREAAALKAGLAEGTVQDEQYRQAKARIGQELSETQRQLRGVASATQASSAATQQAAKSTKDLGDAAEKSGDKTRKGGANAAQALLTLGRGVQDFSAAGLGGVINNVEQFASALGLGAGIAGTATVAAVAVQLLGPAVTRFLGSLNPRPVVDFRTDIERLTAKVKELEDRPAKTIIDLQNLRAASEEVKRLKDGYEAYLNLQEKRTSAERKAGQELEEKLTEALGGGHGFAAAEDAIVGQRTARRIANDPEIQRMQSEVKALDAQIADTYDLLVKQGRINQRNYILQDIEREKGKIKAEEQGQAGGLFTRAFGGRDEDREALARALGEVGMGDLAKTVNEISAASVKAREKEKELDKQREALTKAFEEASRGVRGGFNQAVNAQEQRNARVERARTEREQEAERRRREGSQQSRKDLAVVGRENEAVVSGAVQAIGPRIVDRLAQGRAAGIDPARMERTIAREVDAWLARAGRLDPTNRAAYSDPNRRSALAYQVVERAQTQLGQQSLEAAGQAAQFGALPMTPEEQLRELNRRARGGRERVNAPRKRTVPRVPVTPDQLRRQLELTLDPDEQESIRKQLGAMEQASRFGVDQKQRGADAQGRARIAIEQQRQREADLQAQVLAEAASNQAAMTRRINMLEATVRNVRVIGDQNRQAGRTAQNHGR